MFFFIYILVNLCMLCKYIIASKAMWIFTKDKTKRITKLKVYEVVCRLPVIYIVYVYLIKHSLNIQKKL